MQTVHAPLFSGITDEQQQRMLVCFGVREESFLPEDLIPLLVRSRLPAGFFLARGCRRRICRLSGRRTGLRRGRRWPGLGPGLPFGLGQLLLAAPFRGVV